MTHLEVFRALRRLSLLQALCARRYEKRAQQADLVGTKIIFDRGNSPGLWPMACWISCLRPWGRYMIPPRAKRAPPWGDLGRKQPRRGPAKVPRLWFQAVKTHPKNDSEFRTAFGLQNTPKSLPKTIPEPPKSQSKFHLVFNRIYDASFYVFLLVLQPSDP